MAYGTNCTLCTTINEEPFINWISNNNEVDKNKLVSTTWYRGDNFDYGDNYKTNLESTSNSYEGRIGLIRVGEILSEQSETILSKKHLSENNHQYAQPFWNATPHNTSSLAWSTYSVGDAYGYSIQNKNAVRPVIMISPDVQITSGNGTFNSPYQI